MVVEVISRYSIRKDTGDLREAYYDPGIPEYWLADALGDRVDSQILVRGRSGYEPVQAVGQWVRSDVFGHQFRLVRKHDPAGYWQYDVYTRSG